MSLAFNISGKIEDLVKGDTIIFKQMSIPEWKEEIAFTVIVEKPEQFYYKGAHSHIQYYAMECKPLSGKKVEADITRNKILPLQIG